VRNLNEAALRLDRLEQETTAFERWQQEEAGAPVALKEKEPRHGQRRRCAARNRAARVESPANPVLPAPQLKDDGKGGEQGGSKAPGKKSESRCLLNHCFSTADVPAPRRRP